MHISICCIYILGYNNGQMEPTREMEFQLQVIGVGDVHFA